MRLESAIYFLSLSFGAAGFVFAGVAAAPIAHAADAAAPREPQAIYDKLCKSCHAEDGRGNAAKAATLKIDPALLNLGRPGTETLTQEDRKAILLDGKEKMPSYKSKVKPEEVDPLLELAEKLAAGARKAP